MTSANVAKATGDYSETMVTDFHHNVFYYYGGAHRSDRERERQLEDNTTKALINTLEHCSSAVAIQFLDWLDIRTTAPPECVLQRAAITRGEARQKRQRLLLGLVPPNAETDRSSIAAERPQGDSRPDAWFYGPDYVVLVESKVSGTLDQDQTDKHREKLRGKAGKPPDCETRTWAEVHRFFRGLCHGSSDGLNERDRWTIGQFTQYLEWIGMAEFTGLEPRMFDYLAAQPDQRDEEDRKWLRGTMRGLGDKVLERVANLDASFYCDRYVGQLHRTDDHCWVAFGPGNPQFKKLAHQTIAIYAGGLDVFVNVELKPAINKLRSRVKQNKQLFREIVRKLPAPFCIEVEERQQKQASQHNYYSIARLEAGQRKAPNLGDYGLTDPDIGLLGFDYIETLLRQIHLPYLSVRTRIERRRALELSAGAGEALVREVVSLMKRFHPLVTFINREGH